MPFSMAARTRSRLTSSMVGVGAAAVGSAGIDAATGTNTPADQRIITLEPRGPTFSFFASSRRVGSSGGAFGSLCRYRRERTAFSQCVLPDRPSPDSTPALLGWARSSTDASGSVQGPSTRLTKALTW